MLSARTEPALAAVAAISELALGWAAVVAGHNVTSPQAAAAMRTAEPVIAIVSLEGFRWRETRCRANNMNPWSGARWALGFHPVALARPLADQGQAVAYRTRRGFRATSRSGQRSRTPGAIGRLACLVISGGDARTGQKSV